MSRNTTGKSSRVKVREHRERLASQGLRPVQVWLPDVRSQEFLLQARSQSSAVASSAHAAEDQAFVEDVSTWVDDETR